MQNDNDLRLRHLEVTKTGNELWADVCDEEDQENKDPATQASRVMKVAKDIKIVGQLLQSKSVIAEVYNPPMVTAEGKKIGLKCGFAFDLTVPDTDGTVWDITKTPCGKKAWARPQKEKPYMLVGSPPCTCWSVIQNLNARTPAGRQRVDRAKRAALVHLQFCAAMCREQLRGGR